MRGNEGPVEGEWGAGARLHVAEDFEPVLIPAQFPGEDGGEDDHEKTVGDVCDRGVSRLQASFELPIPSGLSSVKKRGMGHFITCTP